MTRLWDTLIRLPHVPVAADLALVGWGGVVSGGITPTSLHVLPAWLVEITDAMILASVQQVRANQVAAAQPAGDGSAGSAS